METYNVSPHREHPVLYAPEYAPVKENEQVLLSLGINADHIAALPMIVNTGEAFLLLEVRNSEVLQSLRSEPELMRLLSEQYGLSAYCLFSRDIGEQADATTSMFTFRKDGPDEVSRELAAGALACYLYDIAMIKKENMVILQGVFVSPPAPTRIHIHLQLSEGKILSLQPGVVVPIQ
jgi:predicted PhzF superfamily epimerase YddE/YHI9